MDNYEPHPSKMNYKPDVAIDFDSLKDISSPITATQIEEAAETFWRNFRHNYQSEIAIMKAYHKSVIQPLIDKVRELSNEPRK